MPVDTVAARSIKFCNKGKTRFFWGLYFSSLCVVLATLRGRITLVQTGVLKLILSDHPCKHFPMSFIH